MNSPTAVQNHGWHMVHNAWFTSVVTSDPAGINWGRMCMSVVTCDATGIYLASMCMSLPVGLARPVNGMALSLLPWASERKGSKCARGPEQSGVFGPQCAALAALWYHHLHNQHRC
jgi:hypothetical protein